MAWSPPARQRRLWLVEQAGDYATPISHHTRDGTALVDRPLYGTIRRERLLLVLEALEQARRAASPKTPLVPLGELQIEHVMPLAWQTHWPLASVDPLAKEQRSQLVNTLGNLTLVTAALNGAMSNAAWLHTDSKMSKRTALDAHDVLFLNREIVNEGQGKRATWDEASIATRSGDLATRAIALWPGPSATVAAAAAAAAAAA